MILSVPMWYLHRPIEIEEFLNFTLYFEIILNLTEVLRVVQRTNFLHPSGFACFNILPHLFIHLLLLSSLAFCLSFYHFRISFRHHTHLSLIDAIVP